MPEPDRRPLLRIEEVAQTLQISRSMAWKIVNDGRLRSIRIGRAIRIRPSDLEAFINVNEPGGTA